jgi:C4-dicarboxylate-specific signal transduction histidine kinase
MRPPPSSVEIEASMTLPGPALIAEYTRDVPSSRRLQLAIAGAVVALLAAVTGLGVALAGDGPARAVIAAAGAAALLAGVVFVRRYLAPHLALLGRALDGLRQIAATLEERVVRRTRELARSKHQLEESLAELSLAQRQLLEASRKSGMAEVASSVLHNVGNALNSVNVSSHVVATAVAGLRLEDVGRCAQLLGGGALAAARRDALARYLDGLAGELHDARQGILAELEALGRNLEHIKAIVAMQQLHARAAAGFTEVASLDDIVEEALRMNAAALDGDGVEVARRIATLPAVRIDRHKLMQILMNLLSNARHAVVEGDGPRRIEVSLLTAGEDRAAIVVRDHGAGIAPEVLPRVFEHGFTTRKNGNGVGLHASALAARELGGSLSCRSDGRGKGAELTLELPLRRGSTAGMAAA